MNRTIKKAFALFVVVFCTAMQLTAQPFLNEAEVEYEVKTNIQKTMGNGRWAEMMKDNLPQFKTGYFSFTFSNNKSIYKFDHWDPAMKLPQYMKNEDEENTWYSDFDLQSIAMQKMVAGSKIVVMDSLPQIDWEFTNENRIIAGFNCRKAVGIMMDSVYVFAFFSEEIMIPGGPCSVNGLPGLVLGLTIPRMYTSWIATKVNVSNVPVEKIKAITHKKPFSFLSLENMIKEKMNDWIDMDDPDSKDYFNQFFWKITL